MARKKWKAYSTEVEVLDAASDGRAVAKKEDRVIFIKQGVPGDVLEVELYKKEKRAIAGRILQVLTPSKDRIEPKCEHFGVCGGCKWQMMSYEAQLRYKEKQVLDSFSRIGKVAIGEALPILSATSPFFYRNKLEFTFGTKAWLTRKQIDSGLAFDRRVLGFHAPGFYDKIIDIETCYLQNPLVNSIRVALRDYCKQENIPFYDIHSHEGFLRNLVFRSSREEMMVILIVKEEHSEWIQQIFEFLSHSFPEVSNWVYIINPKLNSSYSDLPYHVWKGEGTLSEFLGPYRYQISPTSFFQTHTAQAERMYTIVKDWISNLLPEGRSRFDCVYDLYTGTGSIAIFISALAKKIVGIEYVPSAVEDAQQNIELNELDTSFRFFTGDMKKILTRELVEKEGKPEVIVADPPRQGMDKKVIERILEIAPPYLLYISCKPATQARDVNLLSEAYEVEKIQPIDMFPQTAHVENIALLRLRP